MAFDPNAPWGWAPPEWDAPLVGPTFGVPDALVPPAPEPGAPPPAWDAPPHPSPTAANPYPEYDDGGIPDRAGAAPMSRNPLTNTYTDASGKTIFPYGDAPTPAPRTDQARIAQASGPIGTVGQIGKDVDPNAPQQPATGNLPTFTPEEMAQVTGQPMSYIDFDQPEMLSPPLLEADAISGGMVPGQDLAGAHQTQGTPQMPDDYLSNEELGQKWSTLTPEQQEMERAKIEGARQKFASAKMLDASTKAQKDAEDNARIYQESIKAAQARSLELDAEAQNLARKNPLDSITGSQKVFGVLASIVGGWAANKTGRNMGLEIVEQIANDAAASHAQKLALNARQQGAVGDQVSRAQDAHKASEAVRLATYDGAIKSLETEVQNFDPRGTTALRVMDQINTMKAKRAELLAKYRDEELKRTERLLKEQRELLQLQETQRHNIAGERTDATRAGADWLRAKTEEKKVKSEIGADALLTPDELRARGIAIPPTANVPPMTLAQADKLAKTAKSVEDWNEAARKNSPDERNRQFGVGELVDDQGAPIQFRTSEAATKVATLKGAADFGVQLLDRLDSAYKIHGWSSDLLKSPEWQTAQADFNQYMLEKKNIDALGVLAGPDLTLIKGSMGAVDPTGMRDPGPGLARARANVVEKLNSTVRAEAALPKGRTPQSWNPPKPPPPPTKTPADVEFQEILAFDPLRSENLAQELGADQSAPGYTGKAMATTDALRANQGLTPTMRARIDRIRKASTDTSLPKEERESAAANLAKLASDAVSDAVREYASDAGAFSKSQAENLRDISDRQD